MPFRFVEEEEEEVETKEEPSKNKFRFTDQKVKKSALPKRLAAKGASEFFGGAIGAYPKLAETASQLQPYIESLEEQQRPSFLSSAGLEPAPEKGLLNLLALLGKSPMIQQLTPEKLRKRFAQTTQERFEPQSKLERIFGKTLGGAGEGVAFGIPPAIGAGGGAGESIAEELGYGEKGQFIGSLIGMGGAGATKFLTQVPKALETKPSGLPVRKFEKLKKPTRVTPQTKTQAIQNIESDFRNLTSDLLEKTNKSYKAIVENPEFKSKISDLFETVEKEAKNLDVPINRGGLARYLGNELKKTGEKGISLSPTEVKKRSDLKKYLLDIGKKDISAEMLLDQYRKNNKQLSKLIPYGENALENIGKREALETYNKAIADTIESQFPKTEFADLFKFTNQRWADIKKIETIDKYLDSLFGENKINFKQAEKAVTDPKRKQFLRNALGKEAFKDFTQINKDLLSQENAFKLLKAQGIGIGDLSGIATAYILKPNLAKAKLGKDYVLSLWRTSLSNPTFMKDWKEGLSRIKKGKIEEGLNILNRLGEKVTTSTTEE